MTTADATFQRDLINHYNMFGPTPMIKKLGRKYTISFAGRGFSTLYKTQDEAIQQVRAWVKMVRDWK
jgi:hypothetical protein